MSLIVILSRPNLVKWAAMDEGKIVVGVYDLNNELGCADLKAVCWCTAAVGSTKNGSFNAMIASLALRILDTSSTGQGGG